MLPHLQNGEIVKKIPFELQRCGNDEKWTALIQTAHIFDDPLQIVSTKLMPCTVWPRSVIKSYYT